MINRVATRRVSAWGRLTADEQEVVAVSRTSEAAMALGKQPTLAVGKRRQTHVMIRGDFLRKGVEVQPGVPGVLPPMSGTSRLDLAQWIARDDNPLTGRVLANWLWEKHFGRGLAAFRQRASVSGFDRSNSRISVQVELRQGLKIRRIQR